MRGLCLCLMASSLVGAAFAGVYDIQKGSKIDGAQIRMVSRWTTNEIAFAPLTNMAAQASTTSTSAESNRATTVETSLSNQIVAVSNGAALVSGSISNQVVAESNRASWVEANVSNQIVALSNSCALVDGSLSNQVVAESNRASWVETYMSNQIVSVSNTCALVDGSVSNQVVAESNRAAWVETFLSNEFTTAIGGVSNMVIIESNRASWTEGTLSNTIVAVSGTYAGITHSLSNQILAESNRASVVEASLSNQTVAVSNQVSALSNTMAWIDGSISNQIVSESNRASWVETSLSNQIGSVSNQLAALSNTMAVVDTSISNQVIALSNRTSWVDGSISNQVVAESNRAAWVETSVSNQIVALSNMLSRVDGSLSNQIIAVSNAFAIVDGSISNQVVAESNRAAWVETSLSNQVVGLSNTTAWVDGSLSNQIVAISNLTAWIDGSLSNQIVAESNRASWVETDLSNRITSVGESVDGTFTITNYAQDMVSLRLGSTYTTSGNGSWMDFNVWGNNFSIASRSGMGLIFMNGLGKTLTEYTGLCRVYAADADEGSWNRKGDCLMNYRCVTNEVQLATASKLSSGGTAWFTNLGLTNIAHPSMNLWLGTTDGATFGCGPYIDWDNWGETVTLVGKYGQGLSVKTGSGKVYGSAYARLYVADADEGIENKKGFCAVNYNVLTNSIELKTSFARGLMVTNPTMNQNVRLKADQVLMGAGPYLDMYTLGSIVSIVNRYNDGLHLLSMTGYGYAPDAAIAFTYAPLYAKAVTARTGNADTATNKVTLLADSPAMTGPSIVFLDNVSRYSIANVYDPASAIVPGGGMAVFTNAASSASGKLAPLHVGNPESGSQHSNDVVNVNYTVEVERPFVNSTYLRRDGLLPMTGNMDMNQYHIFSNLYVYANLWRTGMLSDGVTYSLPANGVWILFTNFHEYAHTGWEKTPADETWMQMYPPTNVPTYQFIAQLQPKKQGIYRISGNFTLDTSSSVVDYELAVFIGDVYIPQFSKRFVNPNAPMQIAIEGVTPMNANTHVGIYVRQFTTNAKTITFGPCSLVVEKK